MIAFAVLGLLAFASTGECAIDSWTTPTIASGTGDGGIVLTKAEGYTGTFITFVAVTTVTPIAGYTIGTQTKAGTFAIDSTGVLTLALFLDYEDTVAHVLEIVASDSTPTTALMGTATVTIVVTNVAPAFIFTTQSIEVADATAANTHIATITAIEAGATITYAITAASNTNTDFAISSFGEVTTFNALASATTASYSLVITAADNGATPATGSTTLVVCVGTCPSPSCSGAAALAAGVLSLITLSVAMLK